MHLGTIVVLLICFLEYGSTEAQVSDTEVCPRYLVQPGDTLSSISLSTGFDVYSISIAVEACGKRISPLSMGVICLPGGEYPGCKNVDHFRDNGKCPYYVVQPGDTVDTIAKSVNIYFPEVEKVNFGLSFDTLVPQDLVKLPPWDATECGDDFPKTQRELDTLPPAPPPPPVSASVANGNGELISCDAYMVKPGDTLFSTAATFGIPVSVLVDRNPDVAGGAPFVEGMIIKISDEDECDRYEILDGLADITASLNQPPPAPPPPPPGPRQVGTLTDENSMVYDDITNNLADKIMIYTNDEEESTDTTPIYQNVVSDTLASTDQGGSGPGIGVYIMIGCLCFLLIAVIIIMSFAISNSTKKHGNQDKRRRPLPSNSQNDNDSMTGSATSTGEDSSTQKDKLTDSDSV